MSIGSSLESTRNDLKMMPTPVLVQYKQNPGKRSIDGMPLDMLAGLELSRRAQLQTEQQAMGAPNQQLPTVTDAAAQQLTQGLGSLTPQGQAPQAPTPGGIVSPQFTSMPPNPAPQAQAPAQPQPAPQQMAQPPQGAQMAMQPTQQQSLKLAGGGIVAFKDNKNQPVDVDMPSGDPMGTGMAEISAAGVDNGDTRNILEKILNVPRFPEWKEKLIREEAQKQRDAGQAETSATPPTKSNTPPFAIQNTSGAPDLKTLMAAYGGGGGGGGGFNRKDFDASMKDLLKRTPEAQHAIDVAKEQEVAINNRKSPELTDEARETMRDREFAKNQATSSPYFQKLQEIIDSNKQASKERYADSASNARLRLGLGLLGSRAPGFGEALRDSAIPAMDYSDKMSELQAAADEKNRAAEMSLLQARMADEKGDRKAAQDYVKDYQINKREAAGFERDQIALKMAAAKAPADIADREQKLSTGIASLGEKLSMQSDIAGLRNQVSMAGVMAKLAGQQGNNMPTQGEKLAVEKQVDTAINLNSPTFNRIVKGLPGGQQFLTDLQNKNIKPDSPEVAKMLDAARKTYMQYLTSGVKRGSSGVTPYDQAPGGTD